MNDLTTAITMADVKESETAHARSAHEAEPQWIRGVLGDDVLVLPEGQPNTSMVTSHLTEFGTCYAIGGINTLAVSGGSHDALRRIAVRKNFCDNIIYPQHRELTQKYNDQKKKKAQFIRGIEHKANAAFITVADQLVRLAPNSIKVSITSAKSLYFRLNIIEHDVRYQVFFGKSDLVVTFSIYKDDKLVGRNFGSANEMFEELCQVLEYPNPIALSTYSTISSVFFTL